MKKKKIAKKFRIFVVDDHDLMIFALKRLLKGKNMEVAGWAETGRDAVEKIESCRPDICIIDYRLSDMDGLQVAREIKRRNLPSKIIILTAFHDDAAVESLKKIGVDGYVLKDNTAVDLLNAVKSVMEGKTYFSPLISEKSARYGKASGAEDARLLEKLTAVEKRILALLAENKTSREIADTLRVSPKTVQNHRVNICAKLDLKGSHALLYFAFKNKNWLKVLVCAWLLSDVEVLFGCAGIL